MAQKGCPEGLGSGKAHAGHLASDPEEPADAARGNRLELTRDKKTPPRPQGASGQSRHPGQAAREPRPPRVTTSPGGRQASPLIRNRTPVQTLLFSSRETGRLYFSS